MTTAQVEGSSEILFTSEAATFLRVTEDTLYRYSRDGVGPPVHYLAGKGKRRMYLRSELLAWIAAH